MFRNLLPFGIALVSGAAFYTNPAQAAVFVVDSAANSSTGGTGLATFQVAAGQRIRFSSSTNDLWSLGALPRFSDGNGLIADRFATALDDSGQAVGTKIGRNFALHTQNSLSAPFGILVGEIGGVYRPLGANGIETAWGTGTLNLYNWDSNSGDNTGAISFNLSIVPEPASWALLIAGFTLVGAGLRVRRPRIAATSN
jgi:hypothetical protein